MGWEIAQKADKVRIWSTVTDTWLTDWITRDEAIKFYYDDALLAFKKQVIQKVLSFPHHWPEHGSERKVIIYQEGSERYLAWMRELTSQSDEDYENFINDTFEQIMREINAE